MILMRDFVYDTDKSGKNFLKNEVVLTQICHLTPQSVRESVLL